MKRRSELPHKFALSLPSVRASRRTSPLPSASNSAWPAKPVSRRESHACSSHGTHCLVTSSSDTCRGNAGHHVSWFFLLLADIMPMPESIPSPPGFVSDKRSPPLPIHPNPQACLPFCYLFPCRYKPPGV